MSIDINHPWARVPAAAADYAGGYMTLTNNGTEGDRLVAASCPLAGTIEIRGIKVVGPGLRMATFENGLGLPPGVAITLKPRGYHLLLQKLTAGFVLGQRVPVTLTFEKAGTRDVELVVEAEGVVGKDALYGDGQADS